MRYCEEIGIGRIGSGRLMGWSMGVGGGLDWRGRDERREVT